MAGTPKPLLCPLLISTPYAIVSSGYSLPFSILMSMVRFKAIPMPSMFASPLFKRTSKMSWDFFFLFLFQIPRIYSDFLNLYQSNVAKVTGKNHIDMIFSTVRGRKISKR